MINEEAALDSTLMPVLMRFKGLGKKKEARKQLPHPREMSDAAIAVPDFSFLVDAHLTPYAALSKATGRNRRDRNCSRYVTLHYSNVVCWWVLHVILKAVPALFSTGNANRVMPQTEALQG
jgi:hypothetical protein